MLIASENPFSGVLQSPRGLDPHGRITRSNSHLKRSATVPKSAGRGVPTVLPLPASGVMPSVGHGSSRETKGLGRGRGSAPTASLQKVSDAFQRYLHFGRGGH